MISKKKGFILTFHEIISKDYFEKIISFISNHWDIVPMDVIYNDIVNGIKPKSMCSITFDDGEYSFYKYVYPVLKKNNIPVTLFISPEILKRGYLYWYQKINNIDNKLLKQYLATDYLKVSPRKIEKIPVFRILKSFPIKTINNILDKYLDEKDSLLGLSKNMSKNELEEICKEEIVFIGAHTINHPILLNETEIDSENEIKGSIEILKKFTNKEIKYFAYPNGRPEIDYSLREERILKMNGIKMAFSSQAGFLNNIDSMYSVNRVSLSGSNLMKDKIKLYFLSKGIIIKGFKGDKEIKQRKYIKNLILKNQKG